MTCCCFGQSPASVLIHSVETGATGDLVRHRQTKGAATDRVDLKPPRHTPTLPSLAAIAATGAPFVPGSNTAAHPAASARTKIILDRDHRPGARVSSSGCSAKTG